MPALATDYFTKVGSPGTATTLSAPGHTIAGTTFNVTSTANWPTTTGAIFAVDTFDVSTGKRVPGSYTEWEGVVASSTSITGAVLRTGTDQNYSAGSTTRVYIPVASAQVNRLMDGILLHANQDGSLITAAVQTALGAGAQALNGYNALAYPFNTVTYNGNHSYTCVINGQDVTGTLSPGMRIRTQRTVSAPTQSASLNGTSQYFSKSAPAGMTFTNNFVVSAWVKLSSYSTQTVIASRFNGTSGWILDTSFGQVRLVGYNAGASNYSLINSYQAIPLNKWVHVTAQLDMLSFSTTPTTSYIMIDGVDVPVSISRAGTNPTALVQAGNLEIGAANGGLTPFPGKLAQVAVFSAQVTQATMRSYISQGLAGTETSLISAYSLSGATGANDLNATNANNLTANGAVTTTNADAPWGTQGNGTISATLDYGIVQTATFSTNTTVVIQVPEGCTIPTSGGVAAVAYSSNKVPYLFPAQRSKWTIIALLGSHANTVGTVASTIYNPNGLNLNVPVGEWKVKGSLQWLTAPNGSFPDINIGLSTSSTSFSSNLYGTFARWYQQFATTSNTFIGSSDREDNLSATTATPVYAVISNNAAFTLLSFRGAVSTAAQPESTYITAENALL